MRLNSAVVVAAFFAIALGGARAQAGTKVLLDTSMGPIVVELEDQKAPVTAKNFLDYVDAGFYNGVIFHRVIDGFVIQGGGYAADYVKKDTRAPIKNESDNGLLNRRYTLSMARTSDPGSATSQFFVNLVDNAALDGKGPGQWGYAVFAKVVEGMDVVDKIGKTKTMCKAQDRRPCNPPVPNGMADVPETAVVIKKASRK